MCFRHGWVPVMVTAALTALFAGGCSQRGNAAHPVPLMIGGMAEKIASPKSSAANTLGREHDVGIAIPGRDLESSFRRIVERCTADFAHHCTLLQSDLASGQFPYGVIKIRTDPDAVDPLIAFATHFGRLERRSTTVEDLGDAIQDTRARIQMLTDYRKQLLALQAKSVTNVDAAIKIASELSTVQGNLERANGDAANQSKRTSTEVVKFTLAPTDEGGFWRPIGNAVHDFFGNLSSGVAQAITAVAYILPWTVVVIPGLYLVRFLWRRRK